MLSPNLLISAYAQGVFPMAQDDGQIYWYDPDPRAILPLDGLHVPRRLKQRINRQPFEIRFDYAFRAVMEACAEVTNERRSTWIDENILDSYVHLHQLGYAHSVEAWLDGELVGGLYGVSLRGLFAGESMFHRATDASKICLVYLVRRLTQQGFKLLDVQFQTSHLSKFGVVEIPQAAYKEKLAHALAFDVQF
ncbi:MAG: leucyl/phenylalanyl-tRNA--protein transferase [Candidatus Promineifilaceae bacterium]